MDTKTNSEFPRDPRNGTQNKPQSLIITGLRDELSKTNGCHLFRITL